MPLIEFLACALLVLTSAFLSSSEVALFSLSRFQFRSLKDRIKPSTFRAIKRLLQDPGGLLITILVVNEAINISLSALITKAVVLRPGASQESSSHWLPDLLLSTAITTLIILLACEITPKVIGAKANQLISTLSSSPLSTIYDLMKPIRVLLTRLVSLVSRRPQTRNVKSVDHHSPEPKSAILRESEFLLMVEEGHREGAIQQSELDLIKNVFELNDTRVEAIITSLDDVHTISRDTPVKTALSMLRSNRYSRIPVTTENRRQIVGILYSKDILRAKLEQGMLQNPVSEVMRKPLIVPPSMQLNALFRRFKKYRTHMAVVQNPSGRTLGIVTMNDVLESLFEELLPEGEEKD